MSESRKLWLVGGILAALGVIAGVVVLVVFFLRKHVEPPLPTPGSPAYEQYAEAFEAGTAALDADLYNNASEKLSRAIEIVPQEPAAWANRGLLNLRNKLYRRQDMKEHPPSLRPFR